MSDHPPLPARRQEEPRTYPFCSLEQAMAVIKEKCGSVRVKETHGRGKNAVIILPAAERGLEEMLSYGRRSPANISEQKYLGYGQTFRIDEEGHYLLIAAHFIEVPTDNRGAVSAGNLGANGENNRWLDLLEYKRNEYLKGEFTYNTYADGSMVNPFLEAGGPSEYIIEGHTHPGIGTFFSKADKITGASRAAVSPVCSFVCDPIRMEMLGAVGKDFDEAEIIVYSRDEDHWDDAAGDEQLISPAAEMARLTGRCLSIPGCSGDVRISSRQDGRAVLKVKLVIPIDGKEQKDRG